MEIVRPGVILRAKAVKTENAHEITFSQSVGTKENKSRRLNRTSGTIEYFLNNQFLTNKVQCQAKSTIFPIFALERPLMALKIMDTEWGCAMRL